MLRRKAISGPTWIANCRRPDRDRVAAHLAECDECDLLYREISARAERVATALGALAGDMASAPARAGGSAPADTVAELGGGGRDGGGLGVPPGQSEGESRRRPRRWRSKGRDSSRSTMSPSTRGSSCGSPLGPNNVQADVIVTADGRARAYRLVDNQTSD